MAVNDDQDNLWFGGEGGVSYYSKYGDMMKSIIVFSIIAIMVILAACTPKVTHGMVIASGPSLQSDNARMEAPEVAGEDLAALVEGNASFAFDLYRQLKERDSNLFFSPYSISVALAMTCTGAAGTTGEQISAVMHFELSQDKLHPAFNWLEQEIVGRSEGIDEAFRLQVVNAIWGQKNYKFRAAFLDTLAENYGAGLRILDFVNNPDDARISINDWISGKTGGKIQDLLTPRSITSDTRLVLTNAIYFKAAWQNKFMKVNTAILPFYLLDGSSVTVPMMKQTMVFGHGKGNNYRAVELPYKGNEISMLILLPDEGKFEEFEDSLDYRKLSAITAGLEKGNIQLTMPKFQFESQFSLKETLSALGMADAFSPEAADFSGMTDSKELWLDDVSHKTCVSVDENGTEAAAATAAVMVASLPGTFTIDRPFIFLIRDIGTGSILFMGRVKYPGD